MILQIFGAADVIAALMLYFGDAPGPHFFAAIVALFMFVKGLISLFRLPLFYLPLLMNVLDVVSLLLLAFADVPLDFLKPIVMIALFVKAVPAFAVEIMKLIG